MAVMNPLKVTIENADALPASVSAVNNPEDPAAGAREIPFGRELFIERDDFMEVAAPKYFRLAPGKPCASATRASSPAPACRRTRPARSPASPARWDPPSAELKVKGTIHWVPAAQALAAEVRLYDRLFTVEQPDAHETKDFKEFLNPGDSKFAGGAPVTA
jgi:glutaminyl-tRNA synthetase